MNTVYLVDTMRTPVGKAGRGVFKNTLPDDLLAHLLTTLMQRHSSMDWAEIGDIVMGCAMPEAEQGMNVARIASLLAGLPDTVPAMTINRFCSSGVQSIATAAASIAQGDMNFAIAGGVESMSTPPILLFLIMNISLLLTAWGLRLKKWPSNGIFLEKLKINLH
jgi:acetyl-CoA acyltransferase